jgi:hypothetical protein
MPQWPDDGSILDFEDLIKPLCDALRFAYALQRQNRNIDIPWDGPEIGREERAHCLLVKDSFATENLEPVGRKPIEAIMAVAVRLGIEQGRRMMMTGAEYQSMKLARDTAEALLNQRFEKFDQPVVEGDAAPSDMADCAHD